MFAAGAVACLTNDAGMFSIRLCLCNILMTALADIGADAARLGAGAGCTAGASLRNGAAGFIAPIAPLHLKCIAFNPAESYPGPGL